MTDSPPNARERTGRRIRFAACTLLGAPVALLLVPFYANQARAGLTDRRAPATMAAVAGAMALMPLWILALLSLLGLEAVRR